jgi:hypothetical protein
MIFNFLILFEDDTFKECGRSGQGGSIYVSNNEANFVIVNSESIKSHATSHGLFLYTYINSALKYNFVLYSTISESYYTNSGNGPLYMYHGQIRVISTNSSNNKCYNYWSSFDLYGKDNSGYSNDLNYSTEDSYVDFCYVCNNYAYILGICLDFRESNTKHKCEECNIINNSQGSNNYGTVCNEGSQQQQLINVV